MSWCESQTHLVFLQSAFPWLQEKVLSKIDVYVFTCSMFSLKLYLLALKSEISSSDGTVVVQLTLIPQNDYVEVLSVAK